MSMSVTCPYCDQRASLMLASTAFADRPKLDGRKVWLCIRCDAWALAGPNGAPQSSLANRELRDARNDVRNLLDRLARRRRLSRDQRLHWLAQRCDWPVSETHVGAFDLAQCRTATSALRAEMCLHL